jgi:hypothetical protein
MSTKASFPEKFSIHFLLTQNCLFHILSPELRFHHAAVPEGCFIAKPIAATPHYT